MRGKKAKLARQIASNAMQDRFMSNKLHEMFNARRKHFIKKSKTGRVPWLAGPYTMNYRALKRVLTKDGRIFNFGK